MKDNNKCSVGRCSCEVYILFYSFSVCKCHWENYCDKVINLKDRFKINKSVLEVSKYADESKIFDTSIKGRDNAKVIYSKES